MVLLLGTKVDQACKPMIYQGIKQQDFEEPSGVCSVDCFHGDLMKEKKHILIETEKSELILIYIYNIHIVESPY